jgi:acetyl-CoA acyltransferase
VTNAVIVDAVRTGSGKGKPGGALSGTHPVDLLAAVLRGLLERNDLDPAGIDDVITGCVSQVGEQALNIGRNAVLAAGLPESVPATTVDRQCGSSQQAVHFAAQAVMAGACDVVIAAGVESMSRVPMFSNTAGKDPYGPGIRSRYPRGLIQQGHAAELIAARWKLGREDLDAFAASSHQRAAAAVAGGRFNNEIIPVSVTDDDGNTLVHDTDETVRPTTTAEGLAGLKPAFFDEAIAKRYPEIAWRITPGNSSPLTDAASAVLIMSEERAVALNLRPRARFVAFSVVGDDPELMLTAPIPATAKVLATARLSIEDLDTYEVNEAFASVPLVWAREVGADLARLNPLGGAIALGHALGSTGTRLLGTLLNHLEATGGRNGLPTVCEAGGLANALVIERL